VVVQPVNPAININAVIIEKYRFMGLLRLFCTKLDAFHSILFIPLAKRRLLEGLGTENVPFPAIVSWGWRLNVVDLPCRI
jgi:hypothetical protein